MALVVRTLTLRASLLVTTYVAASLGAASLAAHQLALTLWTFLAFALDADRDRRAGDHRPLRWAPATSTAPGRSPTGWSGGACAAGVATGLLLAALAPVLGSLFTTDPAVRDLLLPVLLVAAVFQPVAGVVFVLDGVLIGAGDGRYLAWGGAVVLAVFAPLGVGRGAVRPRRRPDAGLAVGRLRGRVHVRACRGAGTPRPRHCLDGRRRLTRERSGPRLSARVRAPGRHPSARRTAPTPARSGGA